MTMSHSLEPWELVVTDIEGDSLYENISTVHCATIRCCLTGDSRDYLNSEMDHYQEQLGKALILVGHNVIDFDGPALDKLEIHPYRLSNWFDTLVLSRLIYPDLLGGHSLDAWGKRVGEHKIDWREVCVKMGYIPANAPQGAEFKVFRPEMVGYCNQDCRVNHKVLDRLLKYVKWDYNTLFELQQARLMNGLSNS
jgi:hypothetical protein